MLRGASRLQRAFHTSTEQHYPQSSRKCFRKKEHAHKLELTGHTFPSVICLARHGCSELLGGRELRPSSHAALCVCDGQHPDEDERLQRLCGQGLFFRALDALSHIHSPLSFHTYLCLLRACISKKSLFHVKQVRAHISRHHVNLSVLLGDYFVLAFAKCGSVEDALQFAHTLPRLSAHSWTAIISAYSDSGRWHEALEMYHRMQEGGVQPSSYTFVILFKACGGDAQELQHGRLLHAHACSEGFISNVFVGNTLVSMYGKCGAVEDAENVFCVLPRRDDVSWSALLSVYVQQGEAERALQLFRQMLEDGLLPNQHALVFVLQACSNLAQEEEHTSVEGRQTFLEIGWAVHAHPRTKEFQSDVFLQTVLLTMYGKCGAFKEAMAVFHALRQRDLVAWTAILSVLVEQGKGEQALLLYRVMQEEGLSPNEPTFVVALQACGIFVKKGGEVQGTSVKLISLEIGLALHTDARKYGYASDILIGTALVRMYSACGSLVDAEQVFRTLSQRDIAAWNAMLSSYVDQGQGEKALYLYRQMQIDGVCPNPPTFVLVLQACGALRGITEASTDMGTNSRQVCVEIFQTLHMDACKKEYISNVIVGNALLSLYGKFGTIAEAEIVFNAVCAHDIVSWTTMLSAYVEQDQEEKAFQVHRKMLKEGATLDELAVICVLQACKKTGMLGICQGLHFDIVSVGHELTLSLAVAFIDTYGCCASMEDADAVLVGLRTPDILSWTACITGHSGRGDFAASLCIFEKLMCEGYTPDEITFIVVLSACCHAGLVAQGLEYLCSMRIDYDLILESFHYGIVVDLLGRAGDFVRVKSMLGTIPLQGDRKVWLCLLGACISHGNLELGKQAFDYAVELTPWQSTPYVIMSNIYASQLHDDVYPSRLKGMGY